MIFDRRPIYLIGVAAAALVLLGLRFLGPRVTPEERVREQLAILAGEPWTRLRVQDVQYVGASAPEQVLVRGTRLDTGSSVLVHFIAASPYTSPSAMKRLTERGLVGRDAEVLMLPRSITQEPFRSRFQPSATHVGVALFAGFPDAPGGAAARDTAPAPAGAETQPIAPAAGSTDG